MFGISFPDVTDLSFPFFLLALGSNEYESSTASGQSQGFELRK